MTEMIEILCERLEDPSYLPLLFREIPNIMSTPTNVNVIFTDTDGCITVQADAEPTPTEINEVKDLINPTVPKLDIQISTGKRVNIVGEPILVKIYRNGILSINGDLEIFINGVHIGNVKPLTSAEQEISIMPYKAGEIEVQVKQTISGQTWTSNTLSLIVQENPQVALDTSLVGNLYLPWDSAWESKVGDTALIPIHKEFHLNFVPLTETHEILVELDLYVDIAGFNTTASTAKFSLGVTQGERTIELPPKSLLVTEGTNTVYATYLIQVRKGEPVFLEPLWATSRTISSLVMSPDYKSFGFIKRRPLL